MNSLELMDLRLSTSTKCQGLSILSLVLKVTEKMLVTNNSRTNVGPLDNLHLSEKLTWLM